MRAAQFVEVAPQLRDLGAEIGQFAADRGRRAAV